MKTEILRVKSKSGKRTLFVPTIEGVRIGQVNYARLWEAENELKNYIAHYGEHRVKLMVKKYKETKK